MTKKTRYLMLGSAAIVVAGLCTGLVAYYGGLPSTAVRQAAGPAELGYLPADAGIVAYVNVREVMDSELRRRLEEAQPESDRGRQQFQERTGIDLERDVDRLIAALVPAGGSDHDMVALVQGRFDDAQLQRFAEEQGGSIEEYGGKRLIRHPEARGTGDSTFVLAFLEPGLLAVGEDASVRKTIDTIGGGPNVTGNGELMRLVGDVEAGANAWAVGRFEALAGARQLPQGLSEQIPAIQWFTASTRINGGVSGLVRAEARDAQAASELRDVVEGFLALMKMQGSQNADLQSVLQSLEIGGTGSTVALSFMIPLEAIDSLVPRRQAD